MSALASAAEVETLERSLGDPRGRGTFSWSQAVALDEQELFPAAQCRALDAFGLHQHYVPSQLGGKLESLDTLGQLVRVVARRDLTVAIAHGKTFLGAIPVWVGGDEAQQRALASSVLRGDAVALALTERDVGADLTRATCSAVREGDQYRLNGEKWLINNATRGRWLSLLARTSDPPGPRACSLFLLDKAAFSEAALTPLPKIKTLGIRGADISGLRVCDAHVPVAQRVGPEGHGLEIVLRGLLATRGLIGALSLGAADTALDLVLRFACSRPLRGKTVLDLDHPRTVLATAFADLLCCEAVCRVTARALHVVPSQASLFSAVAKYFVPTTVDALMRDLSVILGARHYLREEHEHGLFQKVARDAQLVALFDGSTVVNLSSLGLQLPRLLRRAGTASDDRARVDAARLFSLQHAVTPLEPQRLSLNGGQHTVMVGFERVLDECSTRLNALLAPDTARALAALLGRLQAEFERESDLWAALAVHGRDGSDSAALFALAQRHAALFSAAVCVQLWWYNRDGVDAFFASADWLVVCLDRALERAGSSTAREPIPTGPLLERLVDLDRRGLTTSLFPFPRGQGNGLDA